MGCDELPKNRTKCQHIVLNIDIDYTYLLCISWIISMLRIRSPASLYRSICLRMSSKCGDTEDTLRMCRKSNLFAPNPMLDHCVGTTANSASLQGIMHDNRSNFPLRNLFLIKCYQHLNYITVFNVIKTFPSYSKSRPIHFIHIGFFQIRNELRNSA